MIDDDDDDLSNFCIIEFKFLKVKSEMTLSSLKYWWFRSDRVYIVVFMTSMLDIRYVNIVYRSTLGW